MTLRLRPALVAAALALVAVLVPLSAGPSGAQEPPPVTIAATPSTGLLDRHEVDVTLTGLTPGQLYVLVDCAVDGCVDPRAYWLTVSTLAEPLSERYDPLRRIVEAGPDGAATTTVSVRRSIGVSPLEPESTEAPEPRPVDCTAEACTLAVASYPSGTERLAEVPVTFAATGTYQWPAAQASATPAPPYRHQQAVTVTASGFEPDTYDTGPEYFDRFGRAFLRHCVDDGTGPDCIPWVSFPPPGWASPPTSADVAEDGTATFALTADRFLRLSETDWRDCAQQECTVTAGQRATSNALPMDFGPVWRPWASADDMVRKLRDILVVRGGPARYYEDLRASIQSGEADAYDVVTALAVHSPLSGDVATLYTSVLHRRPDQGGLAYWVDRLARGDDKAVSQGRLADIFSNTPEVKAQYEALSDADAVEWAYESTLGRGSDPSGRAYWLARLAAGLPRYRMVSKFALAPESKARTAAARTLTSVTWGLLRTTPTADAWAATAPGEAAALRTRVWLAIDAAPAFRGAP